MKLGTIDLAMMTTESNYSKEGFFVVPLKRSISYKLVYTSQLINYRWQIDVYSVNRVEDFFAMQASQGTYPFTDRDGVVYGVKVVAVTALGETNGALQRVRLTLETADPANLDGSGSNPPDPPS